MGAVTVLGYAFFVQGMAGEVSFFYDLGATPPKITQTAGSAPVPSAAPSNQTPPMVEGTIEITDVTGPGDTLDSLLSSNQADSSSVAEVTASLARTISKSRNKPFDRHTAIKPERHYSVTLDRNGRLLKVTLELDPADVFHSVVEGNRIRSWKEDVVLDFKPETAVFRVESSLSESVLKAGEGTQLAARLKKIFSWDIDFHSECVRGDLCKVLFERRYADDRPSGYGRVLCAVYIGRKTDTKVAVLFNGTYYNEKGVELKKSFLRSPLSGVLRVTSRYGRRFHPILRKWRPHKGVDYGAPRGTPVLSVADGRVIFAGWKNGYGKYVCIRHKNKRESRYGHLSRIFKRIRKGKWVKQGEKIGRVGATGLATGPHLDFQFLVKGKHKDPHKKINKSLADVPKTVAKPLKRRFSSILQQRLLSLDKLVLTRRSGKSPVSNLP